MKINWIDILVIVSFIIMITLIIWKLYGDSPTELSIFISITLFIGTLTLKVESRLDKRINKIDESIRMGFNKIKEDIEILKNKK